MSNHETPKYMKLKQQILEWLLSGKLKGDEQIPSEHEIADMFDVSRHTVRQAIGEMANDGWLYRIQGKGTFVRKPQARKDDVTQTIGVITTYISDYIFPLIIRGAEATLREQGYRLMLSSTDNDKEKERQCLEMMMTYPLSGLIVEPTRSAQVNRNLDYFLSLEYRQIPYIMINESYPELNCPYVKVDDEHGGYLAAQHLIELGHRKIAGFFKTDDLQGIGRMRGFMKAHQERRVPMPPEFMIRYSTEEKQSKPLQAAEAFLQQCVDERPTAFVCYNDELAIAILEKIRQTGMRVPDDISLVGFDDAGLAVASEVKLTTLIHPKMDMGIQAAKILISFIKNRAAAGKLPDSVIYKPQLIVRNSTKKRVHKLSVQ